MSTTAKTVQLHRYELVEAAKETFIKWWSEQLVPVRQLYGFTVEFAYLEQGSNTFTWAVSAAGDQEEFSRMESDYADSSERQAAFEGMDEMVVKQWISFVDVT